MTIITSDCSRFLRSRFVTFHTVTFHTVAVAICAIWPLIAVQSVDGGELSERSAALRRLKQAHRSVPSRVVGSPDPPLEFRAERVWQQLTISQPIAIANQPGTSRMLFLTDTPHRLCRTAADPASGEFELLHRFSEGGVAYSIEFHPRFTENGYFYIGWNGYPEREKKSDDQKKHSIVTRFTMDLEPPYEIVPESEVDIISWESNGHNGAAIAFGPDGFLYVTSGDGTSDSDTNLAGQRLDLLLSKVLRIDVDHPDSGRMYSIPRDNPFVGQAGIRPETWAYGFRNPWRMVIDQSTGHVWVGNNGQDLWEQVYLVQKGANYGWSVYEGGHIFYAQRQLGPHPVSKPLFDHPHSESRSLTGGVVYRGTRLAKLHGAYVYGDYSTGKIWAAKMDGDEVIWHDEIADTTLSIAGFGLDAQGELLIVDHQKDTGGFYTLVPNDQQYDPDQFPQRLSQTGLFTDVAGHTMHAGAIPYAVNAPLWSDSAFKSRYLVLPSGDDPVRFHPTQSWDFPDGTVAVKSFGLNLVKGGRATRQWIETRLLVRQAGEWTGYSYAWNDEQTDAVLIAAEGAERDFTIQPDAGRSQQLKWRFPSRSECMVCHSRAAKFVLGLSTLQLNRIHDYGDIEANQIDVWRELEAIPAGKSSDELTRLVDPYDATQPLDVRARSYLHANCAQCHVPAGGGNAQFDLSFGKSLEKTKTVSAAPLHHTFEIPDAQLIAPGEPQRSVLLERMIRRGAGQMPQLATNLPDQQAIELIRNWIRELPRKPAR